MNAATADATRYSVIRIDGRYKVLDAADGSTVTAASRAKAEERAAKLNAETAPVEVTATEVRTSPVFAELTEEQREMVARSAELAAATERAAIAERTMTDEATVELAERVTSGELTFEEAAAQVLSAPAVESKVIAVVAWGNQAAKAPAAPVRKAAAKKAPAVKEPAPEPTSQIGKGVVRFTLTTEAAGTVAYTSGSQINRDYAKAVEENRTAVLRTIKGHVIRQHQA